MRNKEMAAWLARNEQKMLASPEFRMNEPTPLAKVQMGVLQEQSPQRRGLPSLNELIKKSATFEPKGISILQAKKYLLTSDGQKLMDKLSDASPESSPEIIYQRALGQLATGSTIPKIIKMDTPLVKIVPEGGEVSKYSPFFTTIEELKSAAKTDRALADSFGLPLVSESSKYSIFEIKPLFPTEVFVSKVAPTVELGGAIERTGEAWQYLTPNRGEWSEPKLIGTILNRGN